MATAPFPLRPFQLRSVTWLVSQNFAANQSTVGFQLWIDKLGYSPTWSNNGQAERAVVWDGAQVVGYSNVPGFNFSDNGPWLILSGSSLVNHNPDGSRVLPTGGWANYALLGSTTLPTENFVLPTIPRNPPPAPLGLSIDQITRNSLRYNYVTQGDGGNPIITFEAQISPDDFQTVYTVQESSGHVTFGSLNPGTRFSCRSRAINGAGPSPWSNVLSAYTLSGGYISNGSQWLTAEILISDGTSWRPAETLISDGTRWNAPA